MSQVADVKEMMENAKRQIEERRTRLLASQTNEDRLATMTALQARIAATMGNLELKGVLNAQQLKLQTAADRDKSLNLVIDAEGRTVDKRTGEVVQIQSRMPTLKANLRVQQKRPVPQVSATPRPDEKKPEQTGLTTPFILTQQDMDETQQQNEKATFFDSRLKFVFDEFSTHFQPYCLALPNVKTFKKLSEILKNLTVGITFMSEALRLKQAIS
jgi:hypothetical protein